MPSKPRSGLISVVMPVHNAMPHLDGAVASILDQTHSEFQFVILDDASTDGSTDLLREWAAKDDRIRLHVGDRNMGPAASSNFVVREARGSLIARMDADDISHPDRLRLQLEIMAEFPGAGLIGSLCQVIDEHGRIVRGADSWRLRHSGWFAPFPHGSIMFRRELFDRISGYREQCVYWEDLDLFLRMASLTKVLTIPKPLYQHRQSDRSTRLNSDRDRVEQAVDLMYRCVARLDEGRDYEDLLGSETGPSRVDPRVFQARGSVVLWSGHRPNLFKRLLGHGRLKADLRTVFALGWTGLGSVSPGTLRLALKGIARARNLATLSDANAPVVEWSLPREVSMPVQAPAPGERRARRTS